MIEDILINILALDRFFEDFEFIHCYLGSAQYLKKAKTISYDLAIRNLQNLHQEIEDDNEIDDIFPYYRKTYLKDFIQSVLTQASLFVSKSSEYNFKDVIEKIYGLTLPPPFELDQELTMLNKELNNLGFRSMGDCTHEFRYIKFTNKAQLQQKIHQTVGGFFESTKKRFSPFFPYDLEKLLTMSSIQIEFPPKNCDHPCYYFYHGKFKGSVGIKYAREMEEYYIERFILHEITPGHHFYYLIRQSMLEQKTFDPVFAIDTYYSPENIINEGLALNLFSILQNDIDQTIIARNLIENFTHKIFYNSWYQCNINQADDLSLYHQLLQEVVGFSEESAKENVLYFSSLQKYFAPSYALGNFYVNNFLKKYSCEKVVFLYNQISVNSLKKLERDLDNDKKS